MVAALLGSALACGPGESSDEPTGGASAAMETDDPGDGKFDDIDDHAGDREDDDDDDNDDAGDDDGGTRPIGKAAMDTGGADPTGGDDDADEDDEGEGRRVRPDLGDPTRSASLEDEIRSAP
jgi:hypothetical protein